MVLCLLNELKLPFWLEGKFWEIKTLCQACLCSFYPPYHKMKLHITLAGMHKPYLQYTIIAMCTEMRSSKNLLKRPRFGLQLYSRPWIRNLPTDLSITVSEMHVHLGLLVTVILRTGGMQSCTMWYHGKVSRVKLTVLPPMPFSRLHLLSFHLLHFFFFRFSFRAVHDSIETL